MLSTPLLHYFCVYIPTLQATFQQTHCLMSRLTQFSEIYSHSGRGTRSRTCQPLHIQLEMAEKARLEAEFRDSFVDYPPPTGSSSPISTLPTEILEMIFVYASLARTGDFQAVLNREFIAMAKASVLGFFPLSCLACTCKRFNIIAERINFGSLMIWRADDIEKFRAMLNKKDAMGSKLRYLRRLAIGCYSKPRYAHYYWDGKAGHYSDKVFKVLALIRDSMARGIFVTESTKLEVRIPLHFDYFFVGNGYRYGEFSYRTSSKEIEQLITNEWEMRIKRACKGAREPGVGFLPVRLDTLLRRNDRAASPRVNEAVKTRLKYYPHSPELGVVLEYTYFPQFTDPDILHMQSSKRDARDSRERGY
ncbi:hypothetical protein BJ508DRAFT_344109 [Ascobolus immersus RN42]|uniref:F-box domain-containing protein n=1 Tax=Ascobolus immersus RN42 TaxID=1160509 RepID=A0A3N4IAU8_ASCIM|nr:hypothetical protein BJ508DRAFT_344109 [Ascobolus immersus RN42]